MQLAILYREELKEYDFGAGHPFSGARYTNFYRFLKDNLSDENYRIISAEPAEDADLLLICNREYIDFTREFYRAANLSSDYDERFYLFHSADNRPVGRPGKLEEAARLIVGQAKRAVDIVESGEFEKAVSLGGGMHHAKSGFGEGFCIYNDVAFAAKYLKHKYGLKRILILDTDAHAGNGTSEYFYHDPGVLFIDLHQDPRTLYPGTGFVYQIGEGAGKGYTINVPMPIGAGYDSYESVFEEIIEPVAGEFEPELVVRYGGSDPYLNDQLTQLGLPISGFRMIGKRTSAIAEICQGKEIDLIASGYNEDILPYAWLALISGLAGLEIAIEEREPIDERDWASKDTEEVIRKVKEELKDYWTCLS
ncbi:MAG: histone deacetylase [Methanophagales archaeon]|nr:histone deacetylase [Methanophagales archaeon]